MSVLPPGTWYTQGLAAQPTSTFAARRQSDSVRCGPCCMGCYSGSNTTVVWEQDMRWGSGNETWDENGNGTWAEIETRPLLPVWGLIVGDVGISTEVQVSAVVAECTNHLQPLTKNKILMWRESVRDGVLPETELGSKYIYSSNPYFCLVYCEELRNSLTVFGSHGNSNYRNSNYGNSSHNSWYIVLASGSMKDWQGSWKEASRENSLTPISFNRSRLG